MTRKATAFALALPPRHPGTPSYRWLYSALRAEILDGRLRSGAKIPATRDLARQYRLSR
jgi:GntR family transcriptional regulator/MocR family aminotransferase